MRAWARQCPAITARARTWRQCERKVRSDKRPKEERSRDVQEGRRPRCIRPTCSGSRRTCGPGRAGRRTTFYCSICMERCVAIASPSHVPGSTPSKPRALARSLAATRLFGCESSEIFDPALSTTKEERPGTMIKVIDMTPEGGLLGAASCVACRVRDAAWAG